MSTLCFYSEIISLTNFVLSKTVYEEDYYHKDILWKTHFLTVSRKM